ncbi:MAG TPA: hypothetical protein VFP98_00940, partial [Candidatus Polarisedimenticolia bacterium]|nr:hypothetical protein [Candidatus Polarisedimenticolia bacterium]
PEPLGPHRWRGVARRENKYDLWLVNVLTGSSERKASVATELDDPAVRSARASAPGGAIERFFKAPVWRRLAARADGSVEVEAHDLRFRSLVLDRGAIFRFRLRVRPDGTVERTPDSLRIVVPSIQSSPDSDHLDPKRTKLRAPHGTQASSTLLHPRLLG